MKVFSLMQLNAILLATGAFSLPQLVALLHPEVAASLLAAEPAAANDANKADTTTIAPAAVTVTVEATTTVTCGPDSTMLCRRAYFAGRADTYLHWQHSADAKEAANTADSSPDSSPTVMPTKKIQIHQGRGGAKVGKGEIVRFHADQGQQDQGQTA